MNGATITNAKKCAKRNNIQYGDLAELDFEYMKKKYVLTSYFQQLSLVKARLLMLEIE
jgi:hypothetical protein